VVQNTLIGYCVLKSLKRDLPAVWITDIVHAVGRGWDVAAVTAGVSECIDRRIAVSDMARRHLIELGTSEDRIRLIRNGIDLDRFEPLPPFIRYPFEILFAARLDPVKRPLLLVDIAVELSRRKLPFPFRFVVAGDGPEMKALQRRIDRSGTQALFDLLGHVEDIPSLMSTAGVLLVTSSNEGIPLIIAEAFASARPVIASRVGAIDEILDENTGMLIDPHGNEAAAFADAILQLMNDARLRSRMGAAARRRVEAGYDRRRSRQLYREALETCN
jgi:glycosyltransferase involved in cell wall biosynthesis